MANGSLGTAVITDATSGAYTYTPNLGVTGSDTFTFVVNDGSADSNIGTVTVSIVAAADSMVIQLVSSGASGQANSSSFYPALSADGRYVSFLSYASNLVPGVSGGQVYVYDRVTDTVKLVSLSGTAVPGNGTSDYPSINGDGQFIAFYSRATNLVAGDTNGTDMDIFVHDTQSGQTEVVSVSDTGVWGNNASKFASISNDGRYVAFESTATNLVALDSNGSTSDIYVHDRLNSTTELVNLSDAGEQANLGSNKASISQDGRYVAFESRASNLVTGSVGTQIFVRDRQASTIQLVSVSSGGDQGNGASTNASISSDGRYVVFQSTSTNLVAADTNSMSDIFVHDRLTGVTERVSVSSSGVEGDKGSFCYHQNSISADGQYIIFEADATNLVAGDTNNVKDIFVHDRSTGETVKISSSNTGEEGNLQSWWPSISGDGLIKAFSSQASNLVATDANYTWDIFLVHPLNN